MHALPSLHTLRHLRLFLIGMALVLVCGTAHAGPATPDYGGRDSSPISVGVGDAAPNPAAQAGRALEALVVVLAGVVGVVYVLKRFNLVQPGKNGKPARISGPSFGRPPATSNAAVSVVSSQTLPGGGMLHVVRVGDKNLLLAATPQSITNISEWSVPEPETGSRSDEFEDYLTRTDPTFGIAAANARLRSLLSPEEPS